MFVPPFLILPGKYKYYLYWFLIYGCRLLNLHPCMTYLCWTENNLSVRLTSIQQNTAPWNLTKICHPLNCHPCQWPAVKNSRILPTTALTSTFCHRSYYSPGTQKSSSVRCIPWLKYHTTLCYTSKKKTWRYLNSMKLLLFLKLTPELLLLSFESHGSFVWHVKK